MSIFFPRQWEGEDHQEAHVGDIDEEGGAVAREDKSTIEGEESY